MRTNTKARLVERPCSLNQFKYVLGHQPAPDAPQIPQTLRSHIGARQFGDFGTVLMAERPASADLSDRVERWRGVEAGTRDELPLRAHPHQTAEEHRFNVLFVVTPILIVCWVILGLIAAWFRGLI